MSRNHRGNSNNNHSLLKILAATAVCGIIAAVAGKKKEDLYDVYNNASKKFSHAANSFSDRTQDLSERYLGKTRPSNRNKNLAAGAIAGGLLGLTAMVFLTSDATRKLREQVLHSFESVSNRGRSWTGLAQSAADRWEENVTPWLDKLENLVDALSEHDFRQVRKNGTRISQPLDKILDWTSLAAQLLHSLKK